MLQKIYCNVSVFCQNDSFRASFLGHVKIAIHSIQGPWCRPRHPHWLTGTEGHGAVKNIYIYNNKIN